MGTKAFDLPPKAGWNWLLAGVQLFRKNPPAALVLAASYLGVAIFLSVLLPVVGVLFVMVLSPGLSAGLMTGCRMIERGLPVTPSVIISGFLEENRRLAKPFFHLGLMYAGAALLINLLGSLFGSINYTDLVKEGEVSAEAMSQLINQLAILSVLYIPVMMAFWYAPALVLWHDIAPGKAVFFSWVAVWRNRGAFLIYGMGWLLWVVGAIAVFAAVLAILPLPSFLAGMLNFMLILGIFAMSLCTMYPSYLDVFEGRQQAFQINP